MQAKLWQGFPISNGMENKSISQKVTLLNQTTFRLMAEDSNEAIVKSFTDASLDIFEADFGFAWGKFRKIDTLSVFHCHELSFVVDSIFF